MNKKLIRLTESDLHRIVKESVNNVINEGFGMQMPQENLQLVAKKLQGIECIVRNMRKQYEMAMKRGMPLKKFTSWQSGPQLLQQLSSELMGQY